MTSEEPIQPPGLQHVKVVSPNPKAINDFLRDAVGFPPGTEIEQPGGPDPEGIDPADGMTMKLVKSRRGGDGTGGFQIGSPLETGRFQLFSGDTPTIWATALICPDLEKAHRICVDRGHPCTDIGVTPKVSFFYVEVAGITFELLQY